MLGTDQTSNLQQTSDTDDGCVSTARRKPRRPVSRVRMTSEQTNPNKLLSLSTTSWPHPPSQSQSSPAPQSAQRPGSPCSAPRCRRMQPGRSGSAARQRRLSFGTRAIGGRLGRCIVRCCAVLGRYGVARGGQRPRHHQHHDQRRHHQKQAHLKRRPPLAARPPHHTRTPSPPSAQPGAIAADGSRRATRACSSKRSTPCSPTCDPRRRYYKKSKTATAQRQSSARQRRPPLPPRNRPHRTRTSQEA